MSRRLAIDDCKPEYSAFYPPHKLELMKCAIIPARRPKAVGIMRGRQPMLLLLCVAALTGSVAGKKCRDKKSVKNCGKKRTKNFCNVEAACPKPKNSGKKCKKTRKACRMTCGLCVPGVDPTTNQPINDNYEPPVNTGLASMLTTCSCTPVAAGGWDVTTGVAPAYFCVKTEYKEEVAVNICNGPQQGSALNVAASCPGGMRACGPAGYPPPPPSPSPRSPPPPPSPPAQPPPSLPPSVPPSMPCVAPIEDRAGLVDRLTTWCGGNKDPSGTCAPSTWDTSLVTDMSGILGASGCTAGWGESEFEDMNAWDISKVTTMEVRHAPPLGRGGERGAPSPNAQPGGAAHRVHLPRRRACSRVRPRSPRTSTIGTSTLTLT